MRGKRSKAYRKLLKQYELAFSFRQPYQVLVDADIIKDAHRFAIDLPQYLANTLHGEVKILITQCSMRHLYDAQKQQQQQQQTGQPRGDPSQKNRSSNPQQGKGREQQQHAGDAPFVDMRKVIEKAKEFERRRCGHRPEEYPEPLGTLECLGSCVGKTNKHRYVVASQDPEVRTNMRAIPGVPLIYISRSVMILEPMAHATAKVVNKGERAKFRAGLKEPAAGAAGGKRKREADDEDDNDAGDGDDGRGKDAGAEKKKKKRSGPKGPNPLSVKKAKKKTEPPQHEQRASASKQDEPAEQEGEGSPEQPVKKKRKRKQKRTDALANEGGDEEHAGSGDE